MKKKRKKLDDDEFMYVVFSIPKNAVSMKLKCKLLSGEKAQAKFDLDDIIEAREMYLELDPDDGAFDTYVLTDLGREQIEDDRGVY